MKNIPDQLLTTPAKVFSFYWINTSPRYLSYNNLFRDRYLITSISILLNFLPWVNFREHVTKVSNQLPATCRNLFFS